MRRKFFESVTSQRPFREDRDGIKVKVEGQDAKNEWQEKNLRWRKRTWEIEKYIEIVEMEISFVSYPIPSFSLPLPPSHYIYLVQPLLLIVPSLYSNISSTLYSPLSLSSTICSHSLTFLSIWCLYLDPFSLFLFILSTSSSLTNKSNTIKQGGTRTQ